MLHETRAGGFLKDLHTLGGGDGLQDVVVLGVSHSLFSLFPRF